MLSAAQKHFSAEFNLHKSSVEFNRAYLFANDAGRTDESRGERTFQLSRTDVYYQTGRKEFAFAYASAANTHLAKLKRIQNKVFRIACRVMKYTSAKAVEIECNEMNLSLRRWIMPMTQVSVKFRSTPGHVAKQEYRDRWSQFYGKFTDNKALNEKKINNFFQSYEG